MSSTVFLIVAGVSFGFLLLMLVLALFEPSLPYKMSKRVSSSLDSEEFRRILGALTGAEVHRRNRVEVLTNGEVYYEAELAAIRAARHSINMEAYIFKKGEVARRFVEALTERARVGVQVNLLIDAIGSFSTGSGYFKDLTRAGGRVAFYHAVRWFTLPRINNRTHREMIVIDGEVGFLGGAGVADHWLKPHGRNNRKRRWRDTMFRVEGDAVRDLQSTFAENWLETTGEIVSDSAFFPCCEVSGPTTALVVDSAPTAGHSTRSRMLFQTLLASAQRSIHITSPYFIPDKSARAEMIRAIHERGAEVKIINPGAHTDHLLTRRSSRRVYGELLRAGAKIYEYQPAMIHTKTMIIDRTWSVVGSSNFDHRSFGLNDEVNVAAYDPGLAERLEADFARDLSESRPVTYNEWRQRSLVERSHEWLGWLLERQQ
ncbi:MAG TPA: phospholipase D-like domain-containing protein [Vicinamibacteria bacterium]|nr:phospholipase D-like domain-containing protein [Vicinamibacteria bacterium]